MKKVKQLKKKSVEAKVEEAEIEAKIEEVEVEVEEEVKVKKDPKKVRPKRPPSKYNIFMSTELKDPKYRMMPPKQRMQAAAQQWKKHKENS